MMSVVMGPRRGLTGAACERLIPRVKGGVNWSMPRDLIGRTAIEPHTILRAGQNELLKLLTTDILTHWNVTVSLRALGLAKPTTWI